MASVAEAEASPAQRVAPASSQQFFYTLDGLRGVAILTVLLHHLPDPRVHAWMPGAFFVVDLFFVVSGFVLAHAYQEKIAGGLGAFDFMRIRLIRTWPLYMLALVIVVALLLVQALRDGRLDDAPAFFTSIAIGVTLLPTIPALSWRHFHLYPFNGAAWTLLWELAINAVWAVLVPRLTNRLLSTIVALGFALLVWAATLPPGLDGGANFATWYLGAIRVVFTFFSGVVAYRIWCAGRFAWLRIPGWAATLLVALAVMFRPLGNGAFDVAVISAMPLLVLAQTGEPPVWIRPLCARLGQIAYAVYILHFPLLLLLNRALGVAGFSVQRLGYAGDLLFVLLAFLLAHLADRHFDKPARKWLMQRLMPRAKGRLPGDRPSTALAGEAPAA